MVAVNQMNIVRRVAEWNERHHAACSGESNTLSARTRVADERAAATATRVAGRKIQPQELQSYGDV